ncbi:hypothetical protein QQP08_013389 [Theobroma cacao]|uniref:C2H2-type domain-containing protein n=1 Tax=Theobroma cacao TaxID=3641 RepID=A0A061EUW2_THECC|nr:Uncharacterized protein TCM_020914 [Theobroma cacao]WRX20902.1 hypothetical protein QQP08_013389 [Theobroma cacao]
MASYGWNSRHANTHGLHHARLKSDTDLIACRICGRILRGVKALFDHIEHHLFLDETATKRQLFLSHLPSAQSTSFTNHVNQNPMLPTERSHFPIEINAGYPDLLWAATPSHVCFGSWNNHMPLIQTQKPTAYGGATQMMVPKPQNQCFTRPFLNQLEATLPMEGMSTLVNRETTAKFEDQQVLDVTLKLGRADQD